VGRRDLETAHDYLRWLDDAPRHRRRDAPLGALQEAALSDPDPFLRARCLAVLDHVANEASTHVFAAALGDPVADVRRHAIHGLTCERCRTGDLCLGEVAPAVAEALGREDDAEVRHQLVVVLGRFASRSDLARRTLHEVAAAHPDELLRAAASAVLTTGHTRSCKTLERLAHSASRRRGGDGPASGRTR
jgi:hypothetical protein